MKERRRHIRFKIDQAIEVSYSRENYIYMEGLNLSESGMLCRASEEVESGSRLFLMFSVPIDDDVRIVRCEGIVVRSLEADGHYDIGVRFDSLEEEDRIEIEKYSKKALMCE